MLPKINNKSFLECNESDLEVLIGNEDYRENEYIDYKQNFAFLEITDKQKKNDKISEFKSDVCSFANAEGGYLIFGISDKNGCADEIIGLDISDDNTDRFELDLRNKLTAISPKTPYLQFHFIKLKNGKYVLVLYIKSDSYAPYIHLESEKNYKIYKRIGNQKAVIGYQELKKMFNQSLSLEKEIYNYRMDRINYYRSQEDNDDKWYSQFLLLHIIPETFLDSSYNQNMFVTEKVNNISFNTIFSDFSCIDPSIPCVDGLRFIPYVESKSGNICYLNNNGVAECFLPLRNHLHISLSQFPNGYIACGSIWDIIKNTLWHYSEKMNGIINCDKVFVCVSIIGCKGVVSEGDNYHVTGTIDRNTLLCAPVITEKFGENGDTELLLKKLYLEYQIAIGRKHDKNLNGLIKELYHA